MIAASPSTAWLGGATNNPNRMSDLSLLSHRFKVSKPLPKQLFVRGSAADHDDLHDDLKARITEKCDLALLGRRCR